ncbi:exodeoxyribonuclease V subunit beta [Blochmannia endosymbiont of Camponotus sp. C-003]|uniref:exodeoxyribonuclease V subunit beta n=1 Tax=unclassified Candidatus Blochmanniella TaxID=711328 RepID=UPI00202444D1|nr:MULTISPECIES: exodeoxyribonuclease V subunit beta [unclassified Candidatus Blochmannia]URJ23539.1 exodeoxyribonuclease V subunit beta [Blochmannia endosymbiont of Camponotus sp. C-003]URJ29010.1 exodeoxyribonuclease V subunit beta [Blochmannia endosymbiont of Camponotus sp. C-046]
MYTLNVLDFPLYGINLIEASAGTGKTYTLIIIYLRLLLCLGSKSDFYRPLTVKEILVVTFTKSAVQELRHRIKEYIHQFRLDCMRGYSNNFLLSKLLLQIHNVDLAIHQLSEAEKKINQASIFTIHSFCQNILNYNTIELNMLFNTNIIDNETILYQQACTDFWRRHFYALPLNIASLIQEYWKDPNSLFNDIIPYIHRSRSSLHCYNCNIHEDKKSIATYYGQILDYVDNVKKEWHKNKYNIITVVNSYDINRRIYNKNNLIRWTEKINQWVEQPTIDHTIPNDLQRFRVTELKIYNNSNKSNGVYALFDLVEKLYRQLSLFKTLIFEIAINEIRNDLNDIQYRRSEITLNNLVDVLSHHLVKDKKNKLAHMMRACYPVTLIDEFQDTDCQQFNIFSSLYDNNSENALILIGDPKQSIYAFRGADIFSYMKIRRTISNKYNLNINWRSSLSMVNAINQLFRSVSNPFIFEDIPFIPAVAASRNNMYRFLINNQSQTAMCFWLHPDEIVTIDDYKQSMAQECAAILYNLLNEIRNGTAWLENDKYKRKLEISDITVLVRNHEEASLMCSALSQLNISTVFLSNNKNIFETMESYELSLLLRSILFPEIHTISTALTTVFFGLNATDIESINNNEFKQERIFEEFFEYYSVWKKKGVYLMIQKIIFHYKVPEKLLSTRGGEISLINILHLSELLQDVAQQLQDENALMEWLMLKITQPKNKRISDQNLRLGSNHQLIKISTIHKSKGLEFPLIFLPFVADFNGVKNPFFHDRKSYKTHFNFNTSKSNLILADEERLSEDLRLLYVAVTRSIYHCSIGVGPVVRRRYKRKSNINDLHHSALGYLIQKKIAGNAVTLRKHLKNLSVYSNGDISFRIISKSQELFSNISPVVSNQFLCAKQWKTPSNFIPWNITSFSSLKHTDVDVTTCLDLDKQLDIREHVQSRNSDTPLTPHTFPAGKTCGSFFHSIFQILDFRKIVDIKWLCAHMVRYNIDPIWGFVVREWIYIVLNTPLNNDHLTLSQIIPNNKKTELKFYLSINTRLSSEELNCLCKKYDSLSCKSASLNFSDITGMLQGFIDLVFRWNHRYYLLDYKTNWLGKNNEDYVNSKITQEMVKHHYALQYQLYTLALHRFLRNRLVSYNYEKDFGGVYYLFIRGMDGSPLSNGIYFFRPLSTFINKLDNLFSKK